MFGYRPDGRRVHNQDPIAAVTPYLMPMRCDAQVMFDMNADYTTLINYIAEKSRQGVKITFMELVIAAYVRGVSQVPEINRFIFNKQLFNRNECSVALTLLMDDVEEPTENVVKIKFDPSDTIFDVSARVKNAIEKGRKADDPGFAVHLANFALSVPLLPNFLAGLVKLLDRYGVLPRVIIDELPFYCGLFITNLASIGLNKVYHHIYNFGDVSMFTCIGNAEREYTLDAKGNRVRKCSLPLTTVVDERICAGIYFSRLFSVIKQSLKHPETLEVPPETVRYNEGMEYHVPKPDNVLLPNSEKE